MLHTYLAQDRTKGRQLKIPTRAKINPDAENTVIWSVEVLAENGHKFGIAHTNLNWRLFVKCKSLILCFVKYLFMSI